MRTGPAGAVDLNEAHATGGDARRLADLFGLSIQAGTRHTAPYRRWCPPLTLEALRQQEGLTVVFGLDDALLGWLVASAGDALAAKLRGDPAKKAMRRVVEDAVTAAVLDLGGHLDHSDALHLRNVLREHDVPVGDQQVSTVAELHAALRSWTAALDRPEFDQPGYLTRLGVDANQLSQQLTNKITSGIMADGRGGGPLAPLATWLWRDHTSDQLDRIEGKLDAAPLEAARSRGARLRGGVPDFTGRERALADLAQRIQAHDPAGTVVAIHAVEGMAGVGKTELALRAAHQHQHRYPHGRFDIDLHGYTPGVEPRTPVAALEELLHQAGVPGHAIPPDLIGRQDLWRARMADKEALILLDNARDVEQVQPLLPHSPGCLVLITSRSWLPGLPGQPLWLDVLTLPEAVQMFTSLVSADRCQDQDAVASVVITVGRLPLAIRAVAGQMRKGLTVTDLAVDLKVATRQQRLVGKASPLGMGVRAAFETSLQRLEPAARRGFWFLGLHPGPSVGVPQFAALTGLSTADAEEVLDTLADRNLVTRTDDRVGHLRYRMHDLMSEFARQQADTHLALEHQAAIARLTTWYTAALHLVAQLWAATDPGSPEPEAAAEGLHLCQADQARAWLAAERDNLLAFASRAADAESAHVLTESAWYLQLLEGFASARLLYSYAAKLYQQLGDRRREADAWRELGNLAAEDEDEQAAEGYYRHALAISQQIGHRLGQAHGVRGLGWLALAAGDHQAAGHYFRDALATSQQIGDEFGQANALRGLGHVARVTGDHSAAEHHYRNALATFEQIGHRLGQANALRSLGWLALATDEHQAAKHHLGDALAILEDIGHRYGQVYALLGLGELALTTADYQVAEHHFRNAANISQQIDHLRGEANALHGLGELARATGDLSAAEHYFRDAATIFEQTHGRPGQAGALWSLGLRANEAVRPEEDGIWW